MKIFPGMHYTMGGLWVDFDQQTNIPGVFAAGEADYSIHGANRLGANSLLSCIYGGFVAGPKAMTYAKSLKAAPGDGGHAAELTRQKELNKGLMSSTGTENPFKIWRELGETHDQARDDCALQRGAGGGGCEDRRADGAGTRT